MSSPADELRTAAERLRKLATDATPGPWHRPLNTRYKATVTGALPEGERGTWLDGNDPDTGERERCTVAMVPTWSHGKHVRDRSGRDLEYIAALHPGVGLLLADWLDQEAHHYECGIRAADDVFRDDPAGREAFLTTGPGAPSTHALAVARAILGGQPSRTDGPCPDCSHSPHHAPGQCQGGNVSTITGCHCTGSGL